MIKKYALVIAVLFFGISAIYGQEVRFSFQLGTAIPVGDFAISETLPDSGGFAQPGFDIRFVGERKFKNNIIIGVNLGYSVFGLDKDGIKKVINPSNPEDVLVETQSFQNINLQARVGYNIDVIEDKLGVVPFLDAGLGVFNSAYYAITDGQGNFFLREGNSGVAFLLSPGVDIWFPINDFMNLKIYGSYQFAEYVVDEKYTHKGVTTIIENSTVNYKYSSISAGLGISLVF